MGFTRHHKGNRHGIAVTICKDGRFAVEEFKDDKLVSKAKVIEQHSWGPTGPIIDPFTTFQ
jgi:hypothetical protein